jgi:hypothetical protein
MYLVTWVRCFLWWTWGLVSGVGARYSFVFYGDAYSYYRIGDNGF